MSQLSAHPTVLVIIIPTLMICDNSHLVHKCVFSSRYFIPGDHKQWFEEPISPSLSVDFQCTIFAWKAIQYYLLLENTCSTKHWETVGITLCLERYIMQELVIYKLIRRARKINSSLSFILFATTFLKASSYFSPLWVAYFNISKIVTHYV